MIGRVSPHLARTDEEIERCFAVMQELRPALVQADFLQTIRKQESEGYQLAMLEEQAVVRAVAGFRVQRMLASGKTMYVDDLVTAAAARSLGHGQTMLHWLMERARSEGCASFSLDSGTHRQEAHAFYFRERLRITSFHFFCAL